jgi:predicted DNA-binding protein (UPF0251 family)
MGEQWRPVAGYFGEYAVSDLGNLRLYGRRVPPVYTRDGYFAVPVRLRCRGLYRFVHELVAGAFLPPPEGAEVEVGHRNGLRHDNRVENLQWQPRAGVVANPNLLLLSVNRRCKLDGHQVEQMVRLAESPEVKQSPVAKRFGVSQPFVHAVLRAAKKLHTLA